MKKANVKQTTGVGLLAALIVVLQTLSLALPKIGPGISISLVLIPIVIGGAVYGPKVGALLGGVFAVVVYVFCMIGFDPGGAMVFQASPLLCLLVVMAKGVLCGLFSSLVYALLRKKNAHIAMLLASIVCVVANTGLFLLGMWVFFADVLAVWSAGGNILLYMLSGIVLINMVPELILNVVFSPVAERICRTVRK